MATLVPISTISHPEDGIATHTLVGNLVHVALVREMGKDITHQSEFMGLYAGYRVEGLDGAKEFSLYFANITHPVITVPIAGNDSDDGRWRIAFSIIADD